jgi:ribA/ribD-fused uncharacterized protein
VSSAHLFGGRGDPLSNFAQSDVAVRCGFCQATLVARTVEHGFQAAKATSCADFHKIIAAPTPRDARTVGKRIPLRPDWNEPHPGSGLSVKTTIMLELLQRKYEQPRFRDILLATGDQVLIEDAPWDAFWGAGPDGTGRNVLGRLLMKIREELNGNGTDVPLPGPTPPVQR